MQFNVITLFPDMIRSALRDGVVGQAVTKKIVELNTVNPRTFTEDAHKTIDDRPFGGGDGMVMMYGPLKLALESLNEKKGRVIYLSAQGRPWSDALAREWADKNENITLICGRYGGIDQRLINDCVDEEVSIGDYILSGGEFAALVLIDSITRLRPEVLGNAESKDCESFSDGLLECPLFTRPQGLPQAQVPRIFLSGDHKKIKNMRRLLSILTTLKKRPELVFQSHKVELVKHNILLQELSQNDWESCGFDQLQVNTWFKEIFDAQS